MITCLINHVTRNQKGLPASHEIRIAADVIELGRGSACQVCLPDHRVSLLHAKLRRTDEGVCIEAAPDSLLSINGLLAQTAVLSAGMHIEMGPYHLTVKPAVDRADISLLVELRSEPMGGDRAANDPPRTLRGLGVSKRRLGAWLAVLILLGLLVVPMLTRVSPAFEDWQAQLPLTLTGGLNPSPLAPGHSVFGMKCSSCHQNAFQAVADKACTHCHDRMGQHQVAAGPQAEKFAAIRCADCHAAHQGKADAHKNGSANCLACHQEVGAAVTRANDFGTDHPAFHLAIPDGKQVIRVEQKALPMPAEKSGLKFSHQLHSAKGGVKSPTGNTVLECRDCHTLETSGEHFAPMDMKTTCQQSQCHKLRLSEPANGVIPHGPERDAMNKLRNFYAKRLADEPSDYSRQCSNVTKEGSLVKRTLACADMLARNHAAESLFKTTGKTLDCALCHEIVETNTTEAPWKVMPVRPRHDWQPAARFNHTKHASMACTACHDKANSKSSADISFPTIEQCRACHVGSEGRSGKVASNCEDCHQFHRIAGEHP